MYKKEIGGWTSDKYNESIILWCREPFNKVNMLEKATKGKQTAEAVYLMERAAKLGNARAALAMGQLFQYGWAVSKSRKFALMWYEKAAALGDREAAELLEKLKKQKRVRLIASLTAVLLGVCLIGAAILWLPELLPVKGILVHEDTELLQTTNLDEYTDALNDLVSRYDDELVISGQRGSNRLMLRFEGEGIDLSDFPAAMVLANEENFLIVQFTSEEEMQRCLDILKQTKGILFVEEDEYETTTGEVLTAADLTSTGVPYTSPYTGENYYSWGVEYLGLDRLAAWLMTQQTDPVTVAVLDTGSEPCAENAHLYLTGYDVVDQSNSNGWSDHDGHGTHVAGTIIDCTWGLDVSILPVRVLAPGGSPESYIILGLQYAIQNDVDVINMSLGGKCMPTSPDAVCNSAKDFYIQDAIGQGIVVVVAAGNGDDYGNPVSTMGHCPAHLGICIVVAACDSRDRLADFSNYGESVDVCAPGVDVISYYPGDTLMTLDGTSMATPHVSALVAMLKMIMPNKTPAQIEKYITDYCIDMGNDMYYGAGIPWTGYFAGD